MSNYDWSLVLSVCVNSQLDVHVGYAVELTW